MNPEDLGILVVTRRIEEKLYSNIAEIRVHFPGSQVVLAIDSPNLTHSPEILRELGIEIIFTGYRLGKPLAVAKALKRIRSKWVLLIDSDTLPRFSAQETLEILERCEDIDLVLLKTSSRTRDGIIHRIQDMDYLFSSHVMRRYLDLPVGSIGPASIWRKSSLEHVMTLHDGVFEGDDLQMLLIKALDSPEKIVYEERLEVLTDPRKTLADLVIQRAMVWIPGFFHNISRFYVALYSRKEILLLYYIWIFTLELISLFLRILAPVLIITNQIEDLARVYGITIIVTHILLVILGALRGRKAIRVTVKLILATSSPALAIALLTITSSWDIYSYLLYIAGFILQAIVFHALFKQYSEYRKFSMAVAYTVFQIIQCVLLDLAGLVVYLLKRARGRHLGKSLSIYREKLLRVRHINKAHINKARKA
jgi:hypothetical protein